MASPTPQPTLREQQKDLTRKLLTAAALAEFADKNYSSVTIGDIVARAGTSRATFYLHFGSKLDVLRALGEESMPSVYALYRQLDTALAGRSGEDLRAWIDAMFVWIDEHRTYVESLTEIIAARDPDVEGLTRTGHLVDTLTRYLDGLPADQRDRGRARVTRMVDDLWTTSRVVQREGYRVHRATLAEDVLTAWCAVFEFPRPAS